ncbi:MAG: tetratricopeptide repeat protein, partial [Archangium sp.]|nr:tetratricopeptide repeat protein [Archangium sp.]
MSTSGLSAAEYAKALEAARAHERAGDWQRALDWFRRLASAEDVVRLLAGRRDFRGAAEYLLQQLPGRGFDTAKLNAEQRKRALTASHLLARAGDTEGAVRLLTSLGEKARAAEVLEKAGDFDGAAQLREVPKPASRASVKPPTAPPLPPPSAPRQPVRNAAQLDAARRIEAQGNRAAALEGYVQAGAPAEGARLASELGHHARAASLFVQAGKFYEASVCAWRAGDAAKAFDLIQRVPATDPRYRQAAADAVRLAMTVPNVSIAFEYFIGPFVESPPESEKDVETLYALAQLYDKLGLPQNAIEALQRVLAVAPGYRDAAAWVAKLNTIDADRLRQVTEEDQAFERASSAGNRTLGGVGLAALPDLPDL